MPIVPSRKKTRCVNIATTIPAEQNAELDAYTAWADAGRSECVQAGLRLLFEQDWEWIQHKAKQAEVR